MLLAAGAIALSLAVWSLCSTEERGLWPARRLL